MSKFFICPWKWLTDNNIKNELGLLLLISDISHKEGYCDKPNKYFANKFCIDEVTVSRKIKKLIKNGYLEVEYIKSGCIIDERRLSLKY